MARRSNSGGEFGCLLLIVAAILLKDYWQWAVGILAAFLIERWLASQDRKRKIDQQFKEAIRIVRAHKDELTVRRKQTTSKGPYGLVDQSRWQKDKDIFVNGVILPRLAAPLLGDNYAQLVSAIDSITANFSSVRASFDVAGDPLQYEQFVADELTSYGWNTRLTVASGDQGVDVIAERDSLKVVLQCKLYSHPVGNDAVQQIYAGCQFELADAAVVVTNADYTRAAKQLASTNGVLLLHHDQLNQLHSLVEPGAPVPPRTTPAQTARPSGTNAPMDSMAVTTDTTSLRARLVATALIPLLITGGIIVYYKLAASAGRKSFEQGAIAGRSPQSDVKSESSQAGPDETAAALASFKTYNSQSLVELLSTYGVVVNSISIKPGNTDFSAIQPGDRVIFLRLQHKDGTPLPCEAMDHMFSVGNTRKSEFVEHASGEHFLIDGIDDPIIYWATTGKCAEGSRNPAQTSPAGSQPE